MSPKSSKVSNLESLFTSAIAIASAEERAEFVRQACGEDHVLRQQLQQLLQSDESAGSFLEKPPEVVDATAQVSPTFLSASLEAVGIAGHSVLRSLEPTLDVPKVLLREVPQEVEPPVGRSNSTEIPHQDADSRYRLDGEIARGGMGAIIKGRDTDLGRDLAIKVLLDAHKQRPEMIQRFIEEAQIGGQLQHPGIAPVYELGQFADQRPFFTMKLVKGETLAKLMGDRKSPQEERGRFLGIFEQVCQTMAYAHSRGVIHRDLKPANIMVGAFGEVQVMDWGLAKVLSCGGIADEKRSGQKHAGGSEIKTTRSSSGETPAPGDSDTKSGSVMGTPAYMAPEQALGEIDHLDQRADVFGLGAILAEILTGKPPYVSDHGTDVYRMASHGELDLCFKRLEACEADPELIALTRHCLAVEPEHRLCDANAVADQVTAYLASVESKLRTAEMERAAQAARFVEQRKRRRVTLALVASVLLMLSLGAIGWQKFQESIAAQRDKEIRSGLEQSLRTETLPEIERLVAEDELAEAYQLTAEAKGIFPEDPQLKTFWAQVASQWMVQTEPPNAKLYVRRYGDAKAEWGEPIGTTPLTIELAKIPHHWKLELDGFETTEGCAGPLDVALTRKLDPRGQIPDEMVRVAGSTMAELGEDFLIGRLEVTNEQYQEFVDAGGYVNKSYWKQTFEKDGKRVTWDQAMAEFVDQTGQPGPATWENGTYPQGKEQFPVRGISWYEAAAYVAFRGYQLPTIHHWRAASGRNFAEFIIPASNFSGGQSPAAVKSFPGVGPFGTYDTAGNVKEWCFNGAGYGRRYVLGGAWSDPDYMFSNSNALPAFSRDESVGIRCAQFTVDVGGQELLAPTAPRTSDARTPPLVSEEEFDLIRRRYSYDPSALNLTEEVIGETTIWIEEKITFDSTYGSRVSAHVYSPKHPPERRQVLILVPGSGAFQQQKFWPSSYELRSVELLVQSGRTVVWPVYAGMYGRQSDQLTADERLVRQAKDVFRCVDYLESSVEDAAPDIGVIGFSYGAKVAPILLALDQRLSLGILVHGGLTSASNPMERDNLTFAPRVRVPILMINGRSDLVFPLHSSQRPLFESLGTSDDHKRHVVIDGDHGVNGAVVASESLAWMDQYFGPVSTNSDDDRFRIDRLSSKMRRSFARGKFEAAEQEARELVQVLEARNGDEGPELWSAYYRLALAVWRQAGRDSEARELLGLTYKNQARILGADSADASRTRRTLAEVEFQTAWRAINNRDVAADVVRQQLPGIERARELDPNAALYRIGTAWAYYRLGDLQGAWVHLEEASEKQYGNHQWFGLKGEQCWFLRAMISWKAGRELESRNWFRCAEFLGGYRPSEKRAEAMEVLGIQAPLEPSHSDAMASLSVLIDSYPREYNLRLMRGLGHLQKENLAMAHEDLKAAFATCPSLIVTDYFAVVCQLVDDSEGLVRANTRLRELAEGSTVLDPWGRLLLVYAYCRCPGNADYVAVSQCLDSIVDDIWNTSDWRLARSVVDFRSGQARKVKFWRSDGHPEKTLISKLFRTLEEYRDGDPESALEGLQSARQYFQKFLQSPDGSDFKFVSRVHAWAVAKVLMQEVEEAVELRGDGLELATSRTTDDLRELVEERYGSAVGEKVLRSVARALAKAEGDPSQADGTPDALQP